MVVGLAVNLIGGAFVFLVLDDRDSMEIGSATVGITGGVLFWVGIIVCVRVWLIRWLSTRR
jgi:hypothetical protein